MNHELTKLKTDLDTQTKRL